MDRAHFAQALGQTEEPADQAEIKSPKLGYFGVIDERLDLDLLAGVAAARPDWQIVMVGPVVKVRNEDLPRASNIHWLGGRDYAQLPSYLAHWDVALMPFALNEATRFISPTKAPEYLAGGKPVVSTPVADVVSRYAGIHAVEIVEGVDAFVAACETAPTEMMSREAAAGRLVSMTKLGSVCRMLSLPEAAIRSAGSPKGAWPSTNPPRASNRRNVSR